MDSIETGRSVGKEEAGELVRMARARAGVTWAEIAERIGRPMVWTISALLGQHPLTRKEAASVGEMLALSEDVVEMLQLQPYRGQQAQAVASDPTIYRFHEAIMVYGPAIKETIHEQFGDGIMSAINFRVDVTRRPAPDGDRVVVTFDGKFLEYAW